MMELQIDLKIDDFITMYKDGELDWRAEHQVRVWEGYYPTIYEFTQVPRAIAFIRVLKIINEHYLLNEMYSSTFQTLLSKLHMAGRSEELTIDKAMDIYDAYIIGRVMKYGVEDCYNYKDLARDL